MSSQDIRVDGAGNSIFVSGSRKSLSVDVDGADNVVVVRSGGTLRIGGQQQAQKPPHVRRGQIWQHGTLPRRYKIIRVRDNVALCQLLRTNGKPFARDGKPITEERSTINIRYGCHLVTA